jgi:hypothetical protein
VRGRERLLLAQTVAESSLTTFQVVVAVSSAVVAWLALVLGIFNAWTARSALRLARQQEDRRTPQLEVWLSDTFSVFEPDRARRMLGFSLLMTNSSDSPNAVVAADLHLTYISEGQVMTTVKLNHRDEVMHPLPGLDEVRSTPIPVRLDSGGAASAWLLYAVPYGLLPEGAAVEGYELVLRDSYQTTTSVASVTVREIMP